MKKILFAAVAAMAITGCSQNEEIEKAAQNAEIGFNSVVSKTTRAVSADLALLKTNGFTVYAYNTGDAAMGVGTLAKTLSRKNLLHGVLMAQTGMELRPIIGLMRAKYNFLHIPQQKLRS